MIVGIGRCCAVFDYAKVKAVAISNEYSQGYYYTHYNYTVKSNRYDNVRSNQGWQFEEVIGKTVEIYYLKDDPEEIYEERPVDVAEGGILTGFGLIFAVFGSLPIIIGVKALKNKKKGGSDDASSGTPQEYDVSCPYCGNKYKNTANRCPKCGASSRY